MPSFWTSPSGSMVKGSVCNARGTGDVGSITTVGRSPGEGVFLPEKSYGQRRVPGYTPKGHRESHMSERLSMYIRT